MTEINRAEAVGAFIIARHYPEDLFLGVSHVGSKRISGRLGQELQLSIFTETKNKGETDQQALERMLKVEEAFIGGISDKPTIAGVRLSTSILRTDTTEALLHTYLLETDLDAGTKIMDGEIAEIGWVPLDTVLNAPSGAWWIRASVHETIQDYRRWQNNPKHFAPGFYDNLRHYPHPEIYALLEEGFSEREVLYRLGLSSLGGLRPWDFCRLPQKSQPALVPDKSLELFPASLQ